MCNNTNAINLSKNPIQHSCTKHVDIRHNFLRDHALKGEIYLNFISTDKQIADIFIKPPKQDILMKFRRELGICAIFDI